MNKILCILGIVFMMSACSSSHQTDVKFQGGYYKVGTPYQVGSMWYTPKEDYAYNQVGIASYYADDFHNGKTANGETFNMHALTAAHRTLPLPSIVKVTNLENGKSVIVRVNDRGPFVNNRLIDLSKAAAQKLDFITSGTTQVRVEIMAKESKALKEAILKNGGKSVDQAPIILDKTTDLLSSSKSDEWEDDEKDEVIFSPQEKQNNSKKRELKQTHTTGFFIQLGAFSDYDNALSMKNRFEKNGEVVILPIENNGRTIYRVRLGAFNTAQQAVQVMEKIEQQGYTDMNLVEEK